jgi:hypothetical protein
MLMTMRVSFITALLSLVLALSLAGPLAAAPKAEPWPLWEQFDPSSQRVLDHSPWRQFLRRYLLQIGDAPNRMRYGAVDGAGKKALDAYVTWLSRIPVSRLNRPEQRAYWINFYNTLTVKVVLDHYPVASIRDISISPGWFSRGPWGKKLVSVEGTPISLDDIEHRILRPIWKDARLHYVLNCAAIGCPELMAEPFTRFNTERLMEKAALNFVAHARGMRFEGDELVVSSLYRWYADDFGGWPQGVLRHLIKYTPPHVARRLAIRAVIANHTYDWGLNDAATLLKR